MSSSDITALLLTFKLAFISTLCLLILGVPLAWWLARTKSRFKFVIEALVSLPIVLPPTVLGFYLLILFSQDGIFANFFSINLAFSFAGLVVGSVIYSLPFVVKPITNSFELIGRKPFEAAATLGASPLDSFFSIALPLSKMGILSGAVLGFAHTLGEFGVVLMIGGAIPAKTKVVSIAIFEHVEALEYSQAHFLALCLLVISFLLLIFLSISQRKK